MTDPLIDRNAVLKVVNETINGRPFPTGLDITDAVLAYLRSEVLTPEALDPRVEWHGPKRELSRGWTDGFDLHHRIFGED